MPPLGRLAPPPGVNRHRRQPFGHLPHAHPGIGGHRSSWQGPSLLVAPDNVLEQRAEGLVASDVQGPENNRYRVHRRPLLARGLADRVLERKRRKTDLGLLEVPGIIEVVELRAVGKHSQRISRTVVGKDFDCEWDNFTCYS